MFRSDWLLDDPVEVMSDFQKKLVSSDEINSLSTNENISEIDKALFLIEKGQIPQKLWVARSFHSCMKQSGFEALIAEVLDRLPYWNEQAQDEAGKSFRKILENNCFPVKYYENLLLLILHIIETETWAFHDTWGEVFAELAKRYPKRCLAEALPLTAFSQIDGNRLIGGYVLSAVVFAQNGENCEDLLKKIFAMAQDPASVVRKNMCKAFRTLALILQKKKIESLVVPEVLKLVDDDSDEVLESALPLFCEFMDFCSYQYKEEVVEILKTSFFTSQVNKLGPVKLKYLGRILVSLRLCIDEEFRSTCVRWFEGFQETKEEEIQLLMVYNFPALLYIVGSMTDQLFSTFKYLESIQSPQIRKSLSERLGEICQFSNTKEFELFKSVKSFIEDSKTTSVLLSQFFILGKSVKNSDFFIEILISRLSLTSSDWRSQVTILTELSSFINNFDCSRYLDHLFSSVVDMVRLSVQPVQSSICKLISEIFSKTLSKHEENSSRLIQIFGRSLSSRQRIIFLKICSFLSTLVSHFYFHKTFFATLMQLSRDPVKEVVYEFGSHFLKFRLAVPFNDLDSPSEYRKLLNFYLETGDPHLAEVSFEVDGKIDKLVREHYNSAGEARETLKIKQETESMAREIVESRPVIKAKPRKSTLVPRGSSHNPVKRFSLVEIDKAELSRVIQRTSTKKKGVK
jgi:serine/threonine-protein phosphatase 4 regulatory subunit 4